MGILRNWKTPRDGAQKTKGGGGVAASFPSRPKNSRFPPYVGFQLRVGLRASALATGQELSSLQTR